LSTNYSADVQECETKSFSELIEKIPECILHNYTMDRLNNWLFCDEVDCRRDSESSGTSEMDFQDEEETTVYKEVSQNNNSVTFEEIDENDLVPSNSQELVNNDIVDPKCNVTSEDALSAIDTILRFVGSNPNINVNVALLLELKDNICNRDSY
jgi:hypothetical protein